MAALTRHSPYVLGEADEAGAALHTSSNGEQILRNDSVERDTPASPGRVLRLAASGSQEGDA